jgi:uncharacterized membrane protein
LRRLFKRIKENYLSFIHSIGFLPGFITILLFAFSIFMLVLEVENYTEVIEERIPQIIIESQQTARTLLNTLTTGVISLTVFSFTMVMMLMNQAATTYSPRVISGLVSEKSHQIVLGYYLGTIAYLLVILVNIESGYYKFKVPGTSIFIGLFLGFGCLILFVYFITSISRSIQITIILEKLYKKTLKKIKEEKKHGIYLDEAELPGVSVWHEINSVESGYFYHLDRNEINGILKDKNLVVKVLTPIGAYSITGTPIFSTNRKIDDDEIKEKLLQNFIFNKDEVIESNFFFGFKQILEIAIKGLSPSTNDPATAITAIDYLSDLYSQLINYKSTKVYKDDNDIVRVIFERVSFEELFMFSLAALRRYGKDDLIIVLQLLSMCNKLLIVDVENKRTHFLCTQIDAIIKDAKENLSNPLDFQQVNKMILLINKRIENPELHFDILF